MDCGGFINVIKRNGEKGSRFPTVKECVIGTALGCDMRLHIKGVASRHCQIYVDDSGRAILENLTSDYPTLKNGNLLRIGKKEILNNGDKFTVADRTFQWEYLPAFQNFGSSISNGVIHSKESSMLREKVTLPRNSLPRSPGSSNRIAVVSPVRRDNDSVQLKNEKIKKGIPVNKFYRHSLQNSESLQKKKSASRKSCTPRLVAAVSALESKKEVVDLPGVDEIEKGLSKPMEFIAKEPRNSPKCSDRRKSKSFVGRKLMGSITPLPLKNVRVSSASKTKIKEKSPRKSNTAMHKEVASTPRKTRQSLQTTDQNVSHKADKGEVVNSTPEKSVKNTKLKSRTPEVVSAVNSRSLRNGTAGTPVVNSKTPKRSATQSSQEMKDEKKSAFKSRLKTPVKRMLETPGSVQQQAKRLKMTPSTQGKVRKSIGPKIFKEVKRPLFSEIVKKSTMKKTPRRSVKPMHVTKVVRTKIKKPLTVPAIVKLGNSTGHAESPETIIIRKKLNTPHRLLKETKKDTPLKRKRTPKATENAVSRKSTHFLKFKVSAIEETSIDSSSVSDPKRDPKKSTRGSVNGKGNESFSLDASPSSRRELKGSKKTPPSKSSNSSPRNVLVTPITAKRKYDSGGDLSSVYSSKRLRRSISSTPDIFGESSFNGSAYQTPQISQEMFVSPLTTCNSSSHQDSTKLSLSKGFTNSSGIGDTSEFIPTHSPSRKSTPRKISVLSNNIMPTPKRLSMLGIIKDIPDPKHLSSGSDKKLESPAGKAYSKNKANNIDIKKKQSPLPYVRLLRHQSSPVDSRKVSISPKLKSKMMNDDMPSSPKRKVHENISDGINLLKLSLSPRLNSPRSRLSSMIASPKKNSPCINEVNESTIVKGLKSPMIDLTQVNVTKNKIPKHQKSPKNNLTKIHGVKKLLKTPKQQKLPKDDLRDVRGVKKLLNTPKVQKSPKNDLSEIHGVKNLLKTPKQQKSPKNDLRDVRGVKKLLKTPKVQKSPKNDLREIHGVKKLLKTPKQQKSPKNDLSDVQGVKELLGSPKVQKSPKNDLSDVRGVKRLLGTPKVQKSPKNDLREIHGVKKLLKTPKQQKSPKNDLSNVQGVKRLLGSPKVQKSPKNDLSDVQGVKKLLRSPKVQKSPKNDLTDVRGVKKLLKSPVVQRSPKNDLTDVYGVKKLMKTPRKSTPNNDLSDVEGVKELFETIVSDVGKTLSPGIQSNAMSLCKASVPEDTPTPIAVRGRKRIGANLGKDIQSGSPTSPPKTRRLRNQISISEAHSEENIIQGSPGNSSVNSNSSLVHTRRGRKKVIVSSPVVALPRARRGRAKTQEASDCVASSSPGTKSEESDKHFTTTFETVCSPAIVSPKRRRGKMKVEVSTEEKHHSSPLTKGSAANEQVAGLSSVATPKTRRGRAKHVEVKTEDKNTSSPKTKRKAIDVQTDGCKETENVSLKLPRTRRGRTKTVETSYITQEDTEMNHKNVKKESVIQSPKMQKGKVTEKTLVSSPEAKTEVFDVQIHNSPENVTAHTSPLKTRRGRAKVKVESRSSEVHVISNPDSGRKLNVQAIASKGSEDSPHQVTIKTRRGGTKTPEVKDTVDNNQKVSGRGKVQSLLSEESDGVHNSSPKAKRGRTRTQVANTNYKVVASPSPKNVAPQDPVILSLPKTRSRRNNVSQASNDLGCIESSVSEINSVLSSPLKKQSRAKHTEPKTVTFTDDTPILLYESNSPIRPAQKKGSKKEHVEAKINAAPTKMTRGRRTNATGDGVKEVARTTRRRK